MVLSWLFPSRHEWWLEGWDSFASHRYSLPGRFRSKNGAIKAARRQLRRLERLQPSETSGGQDGIQDQVYVCGPHGTRERVRLDS